MNGSVPVENTLNVLVVVDVQDCFMSNLLNNSNFLNLGVGNDIDAKLKLSSKMVKNIVELDKKSNITIFTRDMHPINHISFEGDEGRDLNPQKGYWPHHCRTDASCNPRLKNDGTAFQDKPDNQRKPSEQLETVGNIIEKHPKIESAMGTIENIYKELPVKGNQLSYFFYFTELAGKVKQLNDSKKPNIISLNEIQNLEIQNLEPDYDQLNYRNITPIDGKYYSLWKGERCNHESYSAFNYHLKYEQTYDENLESNRWIWDEAQHPIPIDPKNFDKDKKQYKFSTGLFEFIIDYLEQHPTIRTVNFNICGLVGDVCVMHTAVQGALLYENIYYGIFEEKNVTCNFNVELSATAFLGAGGFKDTVSGYYEDIPDESKDAALQQYKKFYETDTKIYYENRFNNPTYNFVLPVVTPSVGGKRTRKNRKLSMQKRHKSTCKCNFCLFGGGRRKSMKKRRQTKRKRYTR